MRKLNKYSPNAGQPIEKAVVVSTGQAVALLRKLQNNGKVFRVDFFKKDMTQRTMVCRCGVKSKLKGGKAGYNFTYRGLMSVYEFGVGYRTVNVAQIIFIKYGGILYVFDAPIPNGEYPASDFLARGIGRTVPAQTSPMYKELV